MVLHMSDVGVVMDRHIPECVLLLSYSWKQLQFGCNSIDIWLSGARACGGRLRMHEQHEKGTVANEPAMPPGACHAGCPIQFARASLFPAVMCKMFTFMTLA